MRNLAEIALDFPAAPDWTWLGWFWKPGGLLRHRGELSEVAADAAGKLAFLATPFANVFRGPCPASALCLGLPGRPPSGQLSPPGPPLLGSVGRSGAAGPEKCSAPFSPGV
ncbi:MAG: hypothetical protein AB3N13_09100 [Arenibacterium sp.]